MYDFMKDEGALEYGIRDVITMYSHINGTSKREAVLAANEVIKKISKEVQQEEHDPSYVDTDSIKTVKKQAYDDFIRIMDIFDLDYVDILLFTSSGVYDMLKFSMQEKKNIVCFLLALHLALDDVVNKYEKQDLFAKKGGEE